MSKILITGATGNLGNATVKELVKKVTPENIAVLVRDATKADDLKQLGVEIRTGNYDDSATLVSAFTGIDKLLFVSGSEIENRMQQHENVVKAAKEAGVKHVVYTSFMRKDETENSPIAMVAQSHLKAEELLKESGMVYTFLKNGLYMDILPMFLGEKVIENGVIYLPAGDGKTAFTLRNDMALVNAEVLTTEGHENKVYNIANNEAVTFSDIADILTEISGKTITYTSPTPDEFIKTLTDAGVPVEMAHFSLAFASGMKAGEFSETSNDIEKLTGRKPTSIKQFLQQLYAAQQGNN